MRAPRPRVSLQPKSQSWQPCHSLTVSFSVDGRARGTFRQCCQIGLPFEDVQQCCQIGLPFEDVQQCCQIGLPFEDVQQCCQIGLPFEDVQTVLPDWATFWGRSDRVARLGYFLRTFRQCCQIGLLLRTFRQCCHYFRFQLPFEDFQTVLPDRATFWGLFSSVVTTSVASTSVISITSTIQLLLLFQVLLLFQLLLLFKLLLLFQILLLFQLLLLLSDSSTISASTTTFRFFYYFSFYYYFQILQINSFMLCNYRSASSIHTRFLQEMHFLVFIILLPPVFWHASPSSYFQLQKPFKYQNVQIFDDMMAIYSASSYSFNFSNYSYFSTFFSPIEINGRTAKPSAQPLFLPMLYARN